VLNKLSSGIILPFFSFPLWWDYGFDKMTSGAQDAIVEGSPVNGCGVVDFVSNFKETTNYVHRHISAPGL
jgi:hypothetical protein